MQIKTTVRYHFSGSTMAVMEQTTGEAVGRLGLLDIVGENVKYCCSFQNQQLLSVSQKSNIKSPCDPAIPLIHIYA